MGIAVVGIVLLLPTAVFAENDSNGSDTFKVKVYGSGINEDTGELKVGVLLESGEEETTTVTPDDTGTVLLKTFSFDADDSDVGDTFEACIENLDGGGINCDEGTNDEDKSPERITIEVPESEYYSTISDSEFDTSDSDFDLNSEHDYDTEQSATCEINGDNNECNIDQGNSITDVIRDVTNGIGELLEEN